jgi:RND family efflux transporter MFP subunit
MYYLPGRGLWIYQRSPLMQILSISLVSAVVLFQLGCEAKSASGPPPPPDVEVATVLQQDVPITQEWVAVTDGFVNAKITPQVTGYLVAQTYREGSRVQKGDVLFEIDPRPFQAYLDQALGQLAQSQAQLGKARLDVERDTPLAKERAIAQSQLDTEIQAALAAEAVVKSSQANVEQAQLNLGFTKVRSLTQGIAGIAQGQLGDLIGPTSVLTTVSQVDPIKAYIALSEAEYLRFAAMINRNSLTPKVMDFDKPVPYLILGDGTRYPKKGEFIITDRQVDLQTGTIRVAASFPNPDFILRPGQFGKIQAVTETRKNALLVPQKAVNELQGMYQVAVVDSSNKASIRNVTVGQKFGTMWIIEKGLNSGERVVVEGIQKVRNDTPVNIVANKPAAAEPVKN